MVFGIKKKMARSLEASLYLHLLDQEGRGTKQGLQQLNAMDQLVLRQTWMSVRGPLQEQGLTGEQTREEGMHLQPQALTLINFILSGTTSVLQSLPRTRQRL